MPNSNKEKYLEALGMGRSDNLIVAACHPFFVEEVMDVMDNDPDEDDEMFHYPYFDFIFSGLASRPADLVDEGKVDLPWCHFDVYKELEDFDLTESAMIFTRKNYYINEDVYDDDDDKPFLKQFNEDFGTNFTSFAECWNWILDEEKSGQNFVVNIFRDGEML